MRGSERLKEIKEQFEELLDEAKKIVRASGTNHDYERAKAYWINPIQCALESQGMGQGSMEETITSLDYEEEVEQPQTDDEIIAALEEISLEVDGDIRYTYSGRGMYGKQCVGIVCQNAMKCIEVAAKKGFLSSSTDNMGMDAIVYWRHIQVKNPPQGEDK